jgi:hypothetical protein
MRHDGPICLTHLPCRRPNAAIRCASFEVVVEIHILADDGANP